MGPVAEYFTGQCVLVTGASGFVGKVLVEKILRSCPKVHRVFILVRSKKNLSPDQRWAQITQLPLFDKLKEENPSALEKVQVFHADLNLPDLGISEKDKEFLVENSTLVYHSAATVEFDNPMPEAFKQNTRSTYILLELAKQMPKLKGFIYISTAYSNFNRPPTEWAEQVYPAAQDWRVFNRLVDREPITLSILRDKILDNHPNTYTLTKSMAENVVQEYKEYFPVIILRPSIVAGVLEDPLPGWADSLNGITALSLLSVLGMMPVIHAKMDNNQDFINASHVVRSLIVATASDTNTSSGLTVYNCTYGEDRYWSYKENASFLQTSYLIPSKFLIWPIEFKGVENYNLFFFLMFFKIVIPFYLLDRLSVIFDKKPRLIKVAKKIANASSMFKKFAHNTSMFPKDKYRELIKCMHDEDKNDFNLELPRISAHREAYINLQGLLKYILKEDISPKNIRRNTEKLKRLILLRFVWRTFLYTSAAILIFKFCPLANEVMSCIVNLYKEYIIN